jgi:hypothetical protein
MIYTNIQSLYANLVELKLLLSKYKPKIVFLSESRQTDDINDSELNIVNYNLIRCNSDSRRTGGCVIYLCNTIDYIIVKNIKIDLCWVLIIKIKSGFQPGIYGVIYKSPKQRIKKFLKLVDELFEETIDDSNFNLITGDFNIDLNKKMQCVDKINSIFLQHNLIQIVNKFTRETKNSTTIIDYVLTNDNVSYRMCCNDNISDHNVIQMNIDNHHIKEKKNKTKKTFMKYSKEKLLDSIKNCEFYELQGLGLNEKVNFMKNFFNDVVESMSVEKYVNHKDCDNEWYDLECVNMKNEKDYRKFIYSRNKTENNWKTYKLKRNTYKKILRSKHSNFYRQRILKYNNNPKKLWKILKSLYKDKSNRIKMIKFGNNEICDTLEIAVKLNDYYIDSIDCILNSITQVSNEVFDRFIERNDCCFKFKKINQDDIKIILKKNINKTSVDKISGRMLLDSMENTGFADFFVELINQSLMQGEVPEMWKIAIIEPIEKVKNAIKPEEFRPINKLPVAEKVWK